MEKLIRLGLLQLGEMASLPTTSNVNFKRAF